MTMVCQERGPPVVHSKIHKWSSRCAPHRPHVLDSTDASLSHICLMCTTASSGLPGANREAVPSCGPRAARRLLKGPVPRLTSLRPRGCHRPGLPTFSLVRHHLRVTTSMDRFVAIAAVAQLSVLSVRPSADPQQMVLQGGRKGLPSAGGVSCGERPGARSSS
jgi:hypothetical protein